MFDPVTELFFRLDIPNLSHALNVLSFTGVEAISRPFAFELDVVSQSTDLNLKSLMYRPVWLSAVGTNSGINGQILGADHGRYGQHPGHYRLSVGPKLTCLSQRYNQRIFQDLSAPQIIARVLKEHGIRDDAHRFELNGIYGERDYCAQYHESDLQFVQRLCEEEGIHYHFQHSKLRHLLVFSDSQSGFRRAPTCFFQAVSQPGVNQFTVSTTAGRGAGLSRAQEQAEGESTSPFLGAGLLLPLNGHPQKEWNHLWLLTDIQHRCDQSQRFGRLSNPKGNLGVPYSNHFQATPWEVGFRPPPAQPTPRMFGMQRAKVVGPVFNQVNCDSLGRIQVQFDGGQQDEGARYARCWLPVSSILLGEGDDSAWPRVGMDVVVGFVNGDPDQPMVTAYLQSQGAVLTDGAGVPLPVVEHRPDSRLQMRLDPRTFISAGQKIELSGGIVLMFETGSEWSFSVGNSSVSLSADGLKLCSEQILFNAAPSASDVGDEGAASMDPEFNDPAP